jgi:hypothetical protein
MGIGMGLFAQAVYSVYNTISGDEINPPSFSANKVVRRVKN